MFRAAVLTVSDRSAQGQRPDRAGPLVAEILNSAGYQVVQTALVPDEQSQIEEVLRRWADEETSDLIGHALCLDAGNA